MGEFSRRVPVDKEDESISSSWWELRAPEHDERMLFPTKVVRTKPHDERMLSTPRSQH